MALVLKLALPWGHMFYIGLYMEHLKQSSLKPHRVYILHVTSSSRLTKFVENYGPVAENEAASGIRVLYIAYIEGMLNTFMSDTKSLDI